MRKYIRTLSAVFLSLFILEAHAITVNVKASSNVSGLGFSVNGKSHGGAGTSYSKSGLPTGMYSFGVRVNGVFGNDVGCKTSGGKTSIMLNKDTSARLNYNGRSCTVQVN
jgi:hypothetical protein